MIVCITSILDNLPLSLPRLAGEILQALHTWAIPAMVLVVVYRLAMAYRLYLRFDHPVATVLASQFICLLIAMAGMQFGWFYWDSGHRIFNWILMLRVWSLL